MVPRAGLEPARPKSRDFKSLVFTNFTTWASDLFTNCGGNITEDLNMANVYKLITRLSEFKFLHLIHKPLISI